jgi:hypothetical protein
MHFLAGAVVIGQMVGLGAWATLAKGVRIYPNLNALLLSPAGKCRRGEGTKIVTSVARRAGVNVFAGKISPEGLVDELAENGSLLLYSEELSMLLTKQDFQLPLIPVLTKLLLHGEGQAEVRTRTMGERRGVPYVNLSALFTSAPDWFMQTIPEEAFGGGMMSRFLVVCLDDREVYHVDIQAEDTGDSMLDELAKQLSYCRGVLKGHVKGDNTAQKWMEEWYYENETAAVEDERLLPHRNRKPANLLRLAMVLAASAGTAELSRTRLEQSLAIINWMEPTLVKLYGLTDAGKSVVARGEGRVLTLLGTVNELDHSVLVRRCASYFKGGTKELRGCLEGLLEKGLVEAVYREVHTRGWPPKLWRAVVREEKSGRG